MSSAANPRPPVQVENGEEGGIEFLDQMPVGRTAAGSVGDDHIGVGDRHLAALQIPAGDLDLEVTRLSTTPIARRASNTTVMGDGHDASVSVPTASTTMSTRRFPAG